ncbi:MAG TPA: hypothetical protein VEY07_04570 [Thermoplasmata archaeon]|nr:hypothetical protein [Thermoplasmata archaeon]
MTGSTPVLGLLNPVGVLFLIGLYGGGVLLIRETTVRWKAGWIPVLLLGGAYGIAEEGLGTKTFFDAALIHNPFPGPWGHFLGVNWAWAVQLGIFHAVFSIALPILLISLAFPSTVGRPFLTVRGTRAVGVVFGITVAAMFFLFDARYALSPALVVGSLAAMALLALAAYRWPAGWLQPVTPSSDASLRAFLAVGALFVWGFFTINWLLASATLNTPLVVGLQLVLAAAVLLWIVRHVGVDHPGPAQVRLAVGLLSFLLVLATVLDFTGDWGAVVPAALLSYFLFRLARSHPGPASVLRQGPLPSGSA